MIVQSCKLTQHDKHAISQNLESICLFTGTPFESWKVWEEMRVGNKQRK